MERSLKWKQIRIVNFGFGKAAWIGRERETKFNIVTLTPHSQAEATEQAPPSKSQWVERAEELPISELPLEGAPNGIYPPNCTLSLCFSLKSLSTSSAEVRLSVFPQQTHISTFLLFCSHLS